MSSTDREKKFTPGPWYWNGAAGVTSSEVDIIDRTRVCDAWNPRNGMDHPDELLGANANLIAAAPELLEALEAIMEDKGYLDSGSLEDIHAADEAIKKAYGETP